MSSLSLKHIYKVYDGNVKAVNDFCMDIQDKEFIVFVGPSGCGKSTTLRMIAGLEEISAGELLIDGEVMNDYEPKDRNIAMVFQNYALYPHMSVFNNMAFSLKIARLPKEEIKKKVQEAAEILGITEYLDRKPKALSGGQRQRVALGRAIVRNPKVFLLDEPLSNLDAKLRANMRAEITRLHNRLQTTFIYVTHDQVEAMTMGTRIVVMKEGFVQQIDTPKNLYNYPCNMFVAGFIGTPQMNFYDATIAKDGNSVFFNLANGTTIPVDYRLVNKILKKYMDGNHSVVVGIRPDDIRICTTPMDENKWHLTKAIVDVKESLGSETLLHCNLNLQNATDEGGNLVVKVGSDCTLDSGDIIDIAINKETLHVFDKESEQTLKPRIPSINETSAKVVGATLTFAGQTMILPNALAGKTTDGDVVLTIPSDAIRIGDGTCLASIVGKEIIAQKALYQLNVGGEPLFALSDDLSQELGATVFDIDMTKISMSGDCTVDALDMQNHLDCAFVKVREEDANGKKTNVCYLQLGEQKIVCPDEIVKRLLDVKGRKIYKTPLALTVSAKDVCVVSEGGDINGTVAEIMDYGNAKFARISVGTNDVIVAIDCEVKLQDDVRLLIDMSKISLNDTAHDIILW